MECGLQLALCGGGVCGGIVSGVLVCATCMCTCSVCVHADGWACRTLHCVVVHMLNI